MVQAPGDFLTMRYVNPSARSENQLENNNIGHTTGLRKNPSLAQVRRLLELNIVRLSWSGSELDPSWSIIAHDLTRSDKTHTTQDSSVFHFLSCISSSRDMAFSAPATSNSTALTIDQGLGLGLPNGIDLSTYE